MAASRRAPTSGFVTCWRMRVDCLPTCLSTNDHSGPDAMVVAIAAAPLDQRPARTIAIYSDLGFIVLGRVLERGGWRAARCAGRAALLAGVTAVPPTYGPTRQPRSSCVAPDTARGAAVR